VSVKIRLTRTGAKHRPFYRIVVTDSRMPRDGRFIATLGTYDPLTASGSIEVDGELVKEWMKKGARPSVAVKQLLKRAGVVTVETPPVAPKKPSEAVSLDDLRGPEGEEPKEALGETPSAEEVQAAPRAEKAPAKPRKPVRKGASKKEKSKSKSKPK
jgi:small subunit ribosomal protein S16